LFQNKPTVFFSLKNNIIFVKNVQWNRMFQIQVQAWDRQECIVVKPVNGIPILHLFYTFIPRWS
jgi:hypothetical protein